MSVDQVTARGMFRIGEVLGRAWRIFTGNLLFFLGVPALTYTAIASAFAVSVSLVGVAGGNRLLAWASFGLAMIIELGLYTIGQAVVLIGAFHRLCGEPPRIGAALQKALARTLPLVVLAVLWSLAMGICLALAFVGLPFGLWTAGDGMFLFYVLVPLPLVPAAILFVVWAAAVPACLVEGLGPIASMSRSFDLTKGYRWKTFAIVLLAGLLFLTGGLIELAVAPFGPALGAIIEAAWIVVMMALWNCTVLVMYHDLRVAKEGIGTEQVATIFD